MLCLLAFSSLRLSSATISGSGRDIMVVGDFVDIYYTGNSFPVVLATSDGGAVYATKHSATGSPRVIKVDGSARFQWFSEARPVGDTQNAEYYPTTIAEDTSGEYYYVGGTKAGSPWVSFVIKLSARDGRCVNSAILSRPGNVNSYLYTMLVDFRGQLVFGGSYGMASNFAAWFGTINKETLTTAERTFTVANSPKVEIRRIIADHVTFILAGRMESRYYPWMSGVDANDWSCKWDRTFPNHEFVDVRAVTALGSGKYAMLTYGTYFEIDSAQGFSTTRYFPGAYSMTASSEPGRVVLAGYNYTNHSSFAFTYDPVGDIRYDQGATAETPGVLFYSASVYPPHNATWVAGLIYTTIYLGVVVKLQTVVPLNCSGLAVNYLNRDCYRPMNSGSCFGLCESCYLPNDINACSAVRPFAYAEAASLFAGRCPMDGTYYDSSATACAPVMQQNCHPLCGGECLAPNNPNKCAHHCAGEKVEPFIDSSALATNLCRCKPGKAYNTATRKCVLTVGNCHPLCDQCSEANDSTKCVGCRPDSGALPLTADSVTSCVCPSNSMMINSTCYACHPLCNGCTAPNDQTKCLGCRAVLSVVKSGAVAPYTCYCPANTALSHAACMPCHSMCDGCVAPSDNSKCLACAPISGIDKFGATAPYRCACPPGTALSGNQCLPCHPLCRECIEPNDSSKCMECAEIRNLQKFGNYRPYRCACPPGTELWGNACLRCHPLCNGCTESDNSSACIDCVNTPGAVVRLGPAAPYHCMCAPGTTTTVGATCLQCHPLCNGCVAPGDPSKCVSCVGVPNVIAVGQNAPYTCMCDAGSVLESGMCVQHSVCHPLCGGSCVRPNDRSACVKSCASTAVQFALGNGVVACDCAKDSVYNGQMCVPILKKGCHPLCDDAGCGSPGDQTMCVHCANGRLGVNVVSRVVDAHFRSCTCVPGAELIGQICGYTTGCHPNCNKCVVQHNESACIECMPGTIAGASTYLGNTCSCPAETRHFGGRCVPVLKTEECHPLCGPEGCLSPNDPAKCVSCKTSADTISTPNDGAFECKCKEGTSPTHTGVCEDCGKGRNGTAMFQGQCVCSVSAGYVQLEDGVCSKKVSTSMAAVQGLGYKTKAVIPMIEVSQC